MMEVWFNFYVVLCREGISPLEWKIMIVTKDLIVFVQQI